MQKNTQSFLLGFAVLTLGLVLFNSFYLNGLAAQVGGHNQRSHDAMGMMVRGGSMAFSGNTGSNGQAAQSAQTVSLAEFLPKGVPEGYGAMLSVSFDQPVESLSVLSKLDGDLLPDGKLKFSSLDAGAQKRYVDIGQKIACEYCCGATSLVFPNGQPACGCAHSAAMRGLAMHLLQNHAGEFSDEQILGELTKWKTMFFPKQMYAKALEQKNAYSAGGQETAVENVQNVPDMVGGC